MRFQSLVAGVLASFTVASVVACGGATIDPGPASGDGTAPVATSPVPSATTTARPRPPVSPNEDPAPPTSCDGETPSAKLVPVTVVGDQAPAAFGGTIGDGDYHLVEAALHTGVGGVTASSAGAVASTLRVRGGLFDLSHDAVEGGGTARHGRFIALYEVSGPRLSLKTLCATGDGADSVDTMGDLAFSSHGQGDFTLFVTTKGGVPATATYLYMR